MMGAKPILPGNEEMVSREAILLDHQKEFVHLEGEADRPGD